jgi:hypothetical protein
MPTYFATGAKNEYIVATRESGDVLTVNVLDARLAPLWQRELELDDFNAPRVLSVDAHGSDVIATIANLDEGVDRLYVHRYALDGGVTRDSLRFLIAGEETSAGVISTFRSLGMLGDSIRVLARTHYGWSEAQSVIDSVRLELVRVNLRSLAIERSWCGVRVAAKIEDVKETDSRGLTGLTLDRSGRIEAVSYEPDGTITVHRIDPLSGRDEPISFSHPDFNARATTYPADAHVDYPTDTTIAIVISINPPEKDQPDVSSRVLLARLNTRTGQTERVTVDTIRVEKSYWTYVGIAGHVGSAPVVVVLEPDYGPPLRGALPYVEASIRIYDSTHTLRMTERIESFLGTYPSLLFSGSRHAALLHSEGTVNPIGSRYVALRIYDVARAELESSQRLLNTSSRMMTGSVETLETGELIMALGTDGELGLMRIQPQGAHRMAPVIVR